MPIQGQHVRLIARYSTKYSIRGGVGLIFTLLALLFGLIVANAMISPIEFLQASLEREADGSLEPDEVQKQVLDGVAEAARPVVGWVLGSSKIADISDPTAKQEAETAMEAWIGYLLDDHPALLSAIMLVLMWGWPFIVACGAFDMFSGDIASRGLRYQLLRADRGSIFFGRLIGMFATFVIVLALLMGTVTLYMGFKLPYYQWGALLSWAVYGLAAMVTMSLPYLALCSWLSASFGSSMGSLALGSAFIGGVPLLTLIGSRIYEPAENFIYLLPWGIQHHLFNPGFGNVMGTVVGCLAYTALFLFLGYRKFTTRDL